MKDFCGLFAFDAAEGHNLTQEVAYPNSSRLGIPSFRLSALGTTTIS